MRESRRLVLSAVAVALLAGCADLASQAEKPGTPEDDIAVLNSLVALEWNAVATYRRLALDAMVPPEAERFRADHESHAGALIAAVAKLQGKAIEPPAKPVLPQAASRMEALRALGDIERGLASAYLGAVPTFGDRDLARAAASILSVETAHWAVMRRLMGESPPGPFFGS